MLIPAVVHLNTAVATLCAYSLPFHYPARDDKAEHLAITVCAPCAVRECPCFGGRPGPEKDGSQKLTLSALLRGRPSHEPAHSSLHKSAHPHDCPTSHEYDFVVILATPADVLTPASLLATDTATGLPPHAKTALNVVDRLRARTLLHVLANFDGYCALGHGIWTGVRLATYNCPESMPIYSYKPF